MEPRRGFYDLCVPYQADKDALTNILTELYTLGYRTVAVDQVFNHTECARKGLKDIFPEPLDISSIRKHFEQKLEILQRLSISYKAPAIVHDMNISLNIRKFNIICGIPLTDAALQHACSTFPGDIIGIYHNDTTQIHLIGHKYYTMAARRRIHFEIPYTPAIRSTIHRKDIFSVAQGLVSHRKASLIVLTSAVMDKFQLRSPYDLANFGLLLGLSEEQSKSSISSVCREVILQAEGRRHGKTLMIAKNIPATVENEYSDDDGEVDESESDDSMDHGHPAKRQKSS